MNQKNRINFQEIAEKVDSIIDMADDKSLIDDYRTTDVLIMIDKEFEEISTTLNALPDIDLRMGK